MVPRPVPDSPQPPLIPEYFAGREVFITGATGFMGKVLVERLLWTCRDVSRLHLLIRRKKDFTPEKRLQQLKQSQVFDVIREHCPDQLDKLSILAGDVTQPQFGLDSLGISQLNQVSVVFHSAATLNFNEPLAAAVNQNLRSVIRLMDICDQLPNMQVLVHVSTAYCNAQPNVEHIEECVYPAPTSLKQLLALVDALPEDMLKEITPKYIYPKPNTYTFTKSMAESVVAERAASAKYAIAIFRPTIVVSSLRHPFPGWIENLNGPSGAIVGTGKGLLHVVRLDKNKRPDMIPVDICIDTLIAVAWETGVDNVRTARVYNCSSSDNAPTWQQFRDNSVHNLHRHPFDNVLWYPFCIYSSNAMVHKFLDTTLQTIPLIILHYLTMLCGIKLRPSLLTAYKRLHVWIEVLQFFIMREWHFSKQNVRKLQLRLSAADAAVYNLDPGTIDWETHLEDFVKGTRKYLLRESDGGMEAARRKMRILHIIHITTKLLITLFISLLAWRTAPAILRAIATVIQLRRKSWRQQRES